MSREEPLISPVLVRRIAYCILFLFTIQYMARGYREQTRVLFSLDFKTVYGGAQCLLHNCDPYDSQQIYTAYRNAGGPPGQDMRAFRPHAPLYMPSALAMLTPFALLKWGPAHLLWLVVSVGIYVTGVWLIASLCFRLSPLTSAVGIGTLLLTNTLLIELAQPAQLTVGLCAIAIWCLLEKRHLALGVICFAIALAFKPHLCGPVWLYFAFCRGEYRRLAIRIFFVTVLVCLPGIIWASLMPASTHWFHEMQANVAALGLHGKINDPGPTNIDAPVMAGLPTLLSVLKDDPHFYVPLTWAISGGLLGLWFIFVFRMKPSRERDYLAIAAMASVSVLAAYHRNYDMVLLLLIFPGFSLLMTRGFWWQQVTAVFTLFTISEVADNHLMAVNTYVWSHLQQPLSKWDTIFWFRPVPFATTLLALFFVAAVFAWMRRERLGLPIDTSTAEEIR